MFNVGGVGGRVIIIDMWNQGHRDSVKERHDNAALVSTSEVTERKVPLKTMALKK